MARSIDQQIAALKAVRIGDDGAIDEVRKALRSGRWMLVAQASKLVAAHRLDELTPELVTAFTALVADDAKRDPGCRGKLAIAQALYDLGAWEPAVFAAGLRVVQREGYDPVDTAAALRAVCGLAHVHMARPEALDVLARLLADPERNARLGAVQAIGDSGRPDATALLRYMLLTGAESEPEVLAAAFDSLLALAREDAIAFAIELLADGDDDERAEAAAITLGSARATEAVDALARWAEAAPPEQRHRVGYVALALLRSDTANAVLAEVIRSRSRADAIAAARALATFKDDASVVALIREVARETDAATRREIESVLAG